MKVYLTHLVILVLLLLVRIESSLLIDTLKTIGGIITVSSSLIEIYTKIPQKILFNSIPNRLNITNSISSITIIFPGAGGPDKNTNDLLNSINDYNKHHGIKQSYVKVYDWQQWKGNLIRASDDSINVGSIIGNDISTYSNIKYAHLIGISVGSFAANTAGKIIKRQLKDAYVKVTLLDPFCSRGIFHHKYGYNNFGTNVDYAEQYLNTDDPVPFTNDPLPNCYCYDITNTKERRNFTPLSGDNMHSWPVAYFARYYKKLNKRRYDTHDILQRGQVIKVK